MGRRPDCGGTTTGGVEVLEDRLRASLLQLIAGASAACSAASAQFVEALATGPHGAGDAGSAVVDEGAARGEDGTFTSRQASWRLMSSAIVVGEVDGEFAWMEESGRVLLQLEIRICSFEKETYVAASI